MKWKFFNILLQWMGKKIFGILFLFKTVWVTPTLQSIWKGVLCWFDFFFFYKLYYWREKNSLLYLGPFRKYYEQVIIYELLRRLFAMEGSVGNLSSLEISIFPCQVFSNWRERTRYSRWISLKTGYKNFISLLTELDSSPHNEVKVFNILLSFRG